jgi:hypothetical protein
VTVSRRVQRAILTAAFLGAVLAAPALAQIADDDSLAQAWEEDLARQQGWLQRTLHRYFGRAPLTGDELSGRAKQTVEAFAVHAGRPIEVVIVQPVLRFAAEAADTNSSEAWLSSLARRAGTYTREGVVRQYLLFARGDALDPYSLADSERLLRQLPYINDARLVVIPVGGATEGVAVIVEYRDRWPYGVTGKIKTRDRYEASLYTTNLAGAGLLLDNKIIRNNLGEPENGYRGRLAKANLAGTFIDAAVEFEDSWQELDRRVQFQRRAVHPAIRFVGGASWQDTRNRDNGGVPRRLKQSGGWLGRVFQLTSDRSYASGARRTLTPAVSYFRNRFTDRPVTGPDTNRAYHHSRIWLGGLTYQKITDYKTSYLYRMGEVEDIPSGMALQLSAGYEHGEHRGRTVGFIDAGAVVVRDRGDVIVGDLAYGGYLRDRRIEDGLLDLRLGYATPLLGGGRYRHRTYVWLRYTLGVNRTGSAELALGDGSQVRSLTSPGVRGNQRLMSSLEYRLFTPWSLLGFRIMDFGYVDAGAVGDERDAILTGKIYTSYGLGVRLYNPDLVLPTVEIRAGLIQDVDGRGFHWALDLGNLVFPEFRLPGVQPRRVAFR